jgi:hypothetical protein
MGAAVAVAIFLGAYALIAFWTFTRYGLPVAAVTVALSLPYLLIRYILLG